MDKKSDSGYEIRLAVHLTEPCSSLADLDLKKLNSAIASIYDNFGVFFKEVHIEGGCFANDEAYILNTKNYENSKK